MVNNLIIQTINEQLQKFEEKHQHILLSAMLMIPNLVIYFLIKTTDIVNNKYYEQISSIGIFLAVGILLGDLFVHVMPETFDKIAHNHSHDEHDHMSMENQLSFILFIAFFILMTKVLQTQHSHSKKIKKQKKSIFTLQIIPFILSDILHNISDGVTLATLYAINPASGIVVAISLFTEEIFHQIADFGIWLQKGYSQSQFFILQIFTSCFVVAGAIIYEAVSKDHEIQIRIFVIASLTFYIFTQVLPEMLEKKDNLFMVSIQIISMISGFFLISAIEQ